MKILNEIQQKLNCPKTLFNKFGNYYYRSAETILEAVKPLLGEATLTITDRIINKGNRFYVKATATFKEGDEIVEVSAYAREAENKKGMDESQITGSASSYARKYALNGLFLIDDTKDADTRDNSKNEEGNVSQETNEPKKEIDVNGIKFEMSLCKDAEELKVYWNNLSLEEKTNPEIIKIKNNLKTNLK